MAIPFTLLRAFHAVAEHGGFTAAANALGIGQPTVTTQVKELEERYGVELFLRSGRQIQLTGAGEALVEITRRMIALRQDAHDLLSGYGEFRSGDLRLAAVGPFHAAEMIARFSKDYPNIHISMLLGNSEQTLEHILKLHADIAILARTIDDPRVVTLPFSTHRIIAFVPRTHPLFSRSEVTLAQLAAERFVLREPGSTTRRALEAAMQENGLPIDCALEIGSREGVWKAVLEGLGVGVVTDFEFVAHPDLKALTISDAEITVEYRLACLKDRRQSPKIRAFIDTVLGPGR
jgi:aminoethylphosphonate catabolism LysR family transcriptional regulator